MANNAFSDASDLMVGAGELYFSRLNPDGVTYAPWHHMGNCDEFNITTDVTKIEKNSSMNKKRELMASIVTAVKPTGTITMTEYDPFNLALGLYGTEAVHEQTAKTVTNAVYVVDTVPGIIRVKDENGNPYYNIANVTVNPVSTSPSYVDTAVPEAGLVTGTATFTSNAGSGNYLGSVDKTYYLKVKRQPTNSADGSLAGMQLQMSDSLAGIYVDVPSVFTETSPGVAETISIENGLEITAKKNVVSYTDTLGKVDLPSAISPEINVEGASYSTTLDIEINVGSSYSTSNVVIAGSTYSFEFPTGTDIATAVAYMSTQLAGVANVTIPSGVTSSNPVSATSGLLNLPAGTRTNVYDTYNVGDIWSVVCRRGVSAYVEGRDYVVEEQSSMTGMIKIPEGSSIDDGEAVKVSFTVPEGKFPAVSGGSAGEIAGKILYIADPNVGGKYNLEGWKVKVSPNGDLAFIGTDFGSYQLEVAFLADNINHPEAPYYKVVKLGNNNV